MLTHIDILQIRTLRTGYTQCICAMHIIHIVIISAFINALPSNDELFSPLTNSSVPKLNCPNSMYLCNSSPLISPLRGA